MVVLCLVMIGFTWKAVRDERRQHHGKRRPFGSAWEDMMNWPLLLDPVFLITFGFVLLPIAVLAWLVLDPRQNPPPDYNEHEG